MNSSNDCPALLLQLCDLSAELNCSDIHLHPGQSPVFRQAGQLRNVSELVEQSGASGEVKLEELDATTITGFANWLAGDQFGQQLADRGSIDGAKLIRSPKRSIRIRFNIFRASGGVSLALRRLDDQFRTLPQLGLGENLYSLCDKSDGLVLVAGPTGSGKSTTLAALIDYINQRRAAHIVTIEDPIEFVHANKKSLVSQRQLSLDTPGFAQALQDALRQDPDVILVGELRDLETIRTAIEAAQTGHLVLATVHAGDVVAALDRLVGVFPGDERALISQMLAGSLQAVIAQHLIAGKATSETDSESRDTKRVLASEVLLRNPAISNLISNAKLSQIRAMIENSRAAGMYTLDANLAELLKHRKIDQLTATSLARNPKLMRQFALAEQG